MAGGKMKTFFGKSCGRDIWLYTLENEKIRFAVSSYGAALVSLTDKKSGIDTVLGFDTVEEYMCQGCYIGASIGRTANRIEKGIFTLNGITYHLPVNNNGNCNHGGIRGFDKVIWDAEERKDAVIFRYVSADMEEGYPGRLAVSVTYRLLPDGIEIRAEGTPDQDTLFAYTNHSYFNLDGSEDAMDHEVMIHADCFAASDENGLALDRMLNVGGTPFDFRTFHTPAERIADDDVQLKNGMGYDHFYPIAGSGMREFALCRGKKLELKVMSDQPGMHFYSANYLEGMTGKYGRAYKPRSALCFECSFMPNAVNYPDAERKPVVRAGETSVQTIRYLLSER